MTDFYKWMETYGLKHESNFSERTLKDCHTAWDDGFAAGRASVEKGATMSSVTVLPDGSAFSTASWPLPKDHWLYAPNCAAWDEGRDTSVDTPHPILTHAQRDSVIAAMRYAIRGATMNGKESDFDPDALVQNAVYALCGPYKTTKTAAHSEDMTMGEADEFKEQMKENARHSNELGYMFPNEAEPSQEPVGTLTVGETYCSFSPNEDFSIPAGDYKLYITAPTAVGEKGDK